MAEKKNVRPTWAMVRDLERRLASQIDGTSMLVADCDGWRELYREKCMLVENKDERISMLEDKCSAIEKSNRLMDEELSVVRSKNAFLSELCDFKAAQVYRLENMGFWERVRRVFFKHSKGYKDEQ